MNLLVVESVSKSYGEKILMQDINLGIDEGEKIGVLGINGSGKSTLLKLIAGQDEPDSGIITRNKNLRCSYLAQNPSYDSEATVMDMVLGSTSAMLTWQQYSVKSKDLEESSASSDEIISLSQQLDMQDAWNLESDAQTMLTRLGLLKFNEQMKNLSGGQRKRAALAAALLDPGNLLILDEPTNHLDNQTIDWLEKYLQRFTGTLLMVTHDRYFLERVCNRIVELDHGKLYNYPGNYDIYLERKLDRDDKETAAAAKRKALLTKELAWIRRGARARSTKQKARIQRFESLQADQPQYKSETLHISSAASRLGKKTIILKNISHRYQAEKAVINNYSRILDRKERIGIIGPNGIGKSTLINIMREAVVPTEGAVETGSTVKIGYFPQESTGLPDETKVIDYIREAGEYVSDGNKLISAAQMLETFLFTPSVQWTPLGRLSGGEKRRLHLLRILMTAPNVLLLDEPDNDLDIETLTILEDFLDNFEGTVVAVSHDRYFLDRICGNIVAFDGNGNINEYPGNYSDYLLQSLSRNKLQSDQQSSVPTPKTRNRREASAKPLKFSFKEQKEFDEIDDKIAAVEDELKNLDFKIDQASHDYQQLEILIANRREIEQHLDYLLERWTYLNELAELITKS